MFLLGFFGSVVLRQKLRLKLFASSTKNDLVSKDFCLKAETHSDRRRSGYEGNEKAGNDRPTKRSYDYICAV